MTELPQNWIEKELGKFVTHKKGTKPDNLYRKSHENYVPYIDIKAFEKNIIEQYTEKATAKLTKPNNILVVWDGARAGLVGIAPCEGAIGSTLVDIESQSDDIDNKYLYHFLSSKYQYINSKPRGSGTPHVNPDLYWNMAIPLPPKNEQKRIVTKLDAIIPKVDEVNSRLERVPLILKRARQSILNQAITGELTKDWRKEHSDIQSAKELIDSIQENRKVKYDIACKNAKANGMKKPKALFLPQYDELVSDNKNWVKCYIANIFSVETGATPLKSNASYYKDGNIPWVKTGEVQNCEIFEAEEFITEKALRETNVKIFPKDTLLIAMYGEGKTRGQVGRLKFEATTNQACAALVNTDIVYLMNEYVFYYCLSQYNEIRRQAAGGNQPNLNLDKIKLWEIDIPPLEEQEEIVKQVKKTFEKLDKIEEQYKKAKSYTDRITQSILHKAFTGNLVPQDPNDKPVELPE